MAINYSIYQPEIFSLFRTGHTDRVDGSVAADRYFATAIAAACRDIAASFDCSLILSAQRLEETRQCWLHDAERIVTRKSTEPDHLKLCGFLAFWMHRRIVVDATQPDSAVRSSAQAGFMKFGNDICAFMTAFRLAAYFQFQPSLERESDISAKLKILILDDYLLQDISKMMRYKNLSPHALYLILAALFIDIQKPRTRNVLKIVKGTH